MKMEVTFYVGGKTWKETYEVNDRESARITAKQRNPTAKIIGMNPVAEKMKNIDHAEQKVNIRHTSGNAGGFLNSSYSPSSGSGAGVIIIGGLILLAFFAEWILMVGGGAGATWLAENITGLNIKEYGKKSNEDTTDSENKKAIIILASAIIFGGIGFVSGHNFKKDLNEESISIYPQNSYSQIANLPSLIETKL